MLSLQDIIIGNMKHCIIPALLLCALALSSCDAFRRLAGRPTSEDLQYLREARAERIAARRRAIQDSLDRAKADSIALAAVREALKADSIAAAEAAKPARPRWFVSLGTFSVKENAEKLAQRARDAGYEALVVPQRGTSVAVFVNPTEDRTEAEKTRLRLLKEDFCPGDAQILAKK